jgi:sulfur-oxidizing protein SoxY
MHMRRLILAMGIFVAATVPVLAAGNEEPERLARWAELKGLLFGEEAGIAPTATAVMLEAPARALDAALVPVTITTAPEAGVTALSLVVDENPGPVAARVQFGPAGDARELGLRVRVDGYTNVHAVATTASGGMVENVVFVKGAGGCSAPIGVSDQEAMAGMGEVRMRFRDGGPEGTGRATLMIRHPNFNGMQMNQLTRHYTPPRYVTGIEVARGDELVFTMASDISLATDPVIDFLYRTGSGTPIRVVVTDSEGASWSREFMPPEVTN